MTGGGLGWAVARALRSGPRTARGRAHVHRSRLTAGRPRPLHPLKAVCPLLTAPGSPRHPGTLAATPSPCPASPSCGGRRGPRPPGARARPRRRPERAARRPAPPRSRPPRLLPGPARAGPSVCVFIGGAHRQSGGWGVVEQRQAGMRARRPPPVPVQQRSAGGVCTSKHGGNHPGLTQARPFLPSQVAAAAAAGGCSGSCGGRKAVHVAAAEGLSHLLCELQHCHLSVNEGLRIPAGRQEGRTDQQAS